MLKYLKIILILIPSFSFSMKSHELNIFFGKNIELVLQFKCGMALYNLGKDASSKKVKMAALLSWTENYIIENQLNPSDLKNDEYEYIGGLLESFSLGSYTAERNFIQDLKNLSFKEYNEWYIVSQCQERILQQLE